MTDRAKTAEDMRDVAKRNRILQMNPVFRERNFSVQPNLCFVLMPFKQEMNPIYHDHIKKVVEGLNLVCHRADDIFSPTPIIEDIWKSINHARFLIADLTDKNPNVFYEIGIAHTVGKDVILITQCIEDVPFDLRYFRYILYEYTPRGMQVFEQKLKSTILNVIDR